MFNNKPYCIADNEYGGGDYHYRDHCPEIALFWARDVYPGRLNMLRAGVPGALWVIRGRSSRLQSLSDLFLADPSLVPILLEDPL